MTIEPLTEPLIPLTTERFQPPVAPDADPWRSTCSRLVHPSAHTGGEPLVGVIAAGLAAVAAPWEVVGEPPTERCYELLLATDHYDAWLIHWPAGSGLDAHDHGGSTGAFTVVDGVLDEDVVTSGDRVTRRFGSGDTSVFDSDHVHAVVNRSGAGATSVHVYAPPLRSMSFYAESTTGILPGRVQRVEHEGGAWR